MRQATTNFQLNVDNIPVVVSNKCLQKNPKKPKKPKKQKPNKKTQKNKTNQNPGADRTILCS